ncbi:MAG: hypothetical protein IPG87_18130 [Saprospiraceae bacterium]|nr:hypothetical protein [Candidatus Vicinibacter affinis]
MLEPGVSILVEGTYGKDTWRNSDEWFFKVENIMLLSSALEYTVQKLLMYINLRSVNKDMIKRLDQTLKKHKGHQIIRFNILDTEQELSLAFLGIKRKVTASGELFSELDELGVQYKINCKG